MNKFIKLAFVFFLITGLFTTSPMGAGKAASAQGVQAQWNALIDLSPDQMIYAQDTNAKMSTALQAKGITGKIADGKLEKSQTSVGGLKNGESGGYDGLVPLEYEVVSEAGPVYGDKSYYVGRPHVTGGPMEILQVHLQHLPGMPAARVFDVDLHCLTAVARGCSFPELAPSVWSDYQHELTPDQRQ